VNKMLQKTELELSYFPFYFSSIMTGSLQIVVVRLLRRFNYNVWSVFVLGVFLSYHMTGGLCGRFCICDLRYFFTSPPVAVLVCNNLSLFMLLRSTLNHRPHTAL